MDKSQIDMLRQMLAESGDEIEQLERLTAFEGQMKPRIVVYGTYNSGKSSLLNALTGHHDSEFFRVNDIPETREESVFEGEMFHYVDTPGLDVHAEDDRIARRGIAAADLVLIVHRLSAGSLQKEDLHLFKRVIDANNVLLVLTGAEQPEEDAGLMDEISAAVNGVAAREIPLYPVSNPRYLKGIREGKAKLVEISGIPSLIAQINLRGQAISAALSQDRKTRRAHLLDSLILSARSLQRTTQKTLAKKVRDIANREQQFVSEVDAFRRDLEEKVAEYNHLV